MVRAVQQLSGLRIDHYLGVDLARLPGMVDALGGVPVCVVPSRGHRRGRRAAAARRRPSSPATRPRATCGPGRRGSDVTGAAVAERAQRLLTSTLRAAMSTGTLADPLTLTRFLNRAADALTVDEQTTLGDLRALAGSLGDLSGDAVAARGPAGGAGRLRARRQRRRRTSLLDGAATRAPVRRGDRRQPGAPDGLASGGRRAAGDGRRPGGGEAAAPPTGRADAARRPGADRAAGRGRPSTC